MEEQLKREKKAVYDKGVETLNSLEYAKKLINGELFKKSFKAKIAHNSNFRRAEAYTEAAKMDLNIFAQMVVELNKKIPLRFNEDDFQDYADKFFEGHVKDYLVEDNLPACDAKIDGAIYYIQVILYQLK